MKKSQVNPGYIQEFCLDLKTVERQEQIAPSQLFARQAYTIPLNFKRIIWDMIRQAIPFSTRTAPYCLLMGPSKQAHLARSPRPLLD